MIRNIDEEAKIVRWAFAEIIGYMKHKHHRYWFKYNPKRVRVHKIMYRAFESANIPVTRSWYRYGCFIHSTQLAGFKDFSSLKYRYLRSKYPPKRLQSAVSKMGFDVDFAIKKIRDTIDVMPTRMDMYLESLYEGAPEKIGGIYTSKLALHKLLMRSKKIDFRQLLTFQKWLSRLRRGFSDFHMSTFSGAQFEDLTDVTMSFTSNVEEALLKFEKLILQRKRILKKNIRLIHKFCDIFDNHVWVPFALEISARTVKGFRETEERVKQRRKKTEKISESISVLTELSETLAKNDLVLSWREYCDWVIHHKDRDVTNAISEMERIYEESPERE